MDVNGQKWTKMGVNERGLFEMGLREWQQSNLSAFVLKRQKNLPITAIMVVDSQKWQFLTKTCAEGQKRAVLVDNKH